MADYRLPGQHEIEGMVMQKQIQKETLDRLRELRVVEGDTLVASYPKAGSTWMGELSWLMLNEGNIAKSMETPLIHRMRYLEFNITAENTGLDYMLQGSRPALMKTHLPATTFQKHIEDGKMKIIVVIRNPKDTLVSMYNFYRMNDSLGNFTGSWDAFFELYKNKHLIYGDMFDWYKTWLPYLEKPNVKLYAYEDMHSDIDQVIASLSDFLGQYHKAETLENIKQHISFEKMKDNDMVNFAKVPIFNQKISPFMRKGKVGDWKKHLTQEQSDYVDKEYKEQFDNTPFVLRFE